MKKFGRNKDEVFSHFKKSGLDDKKAAEETLNHLKEMDDERLTEVQSFAKSIADLGEKFIKSITDLNAVATLIPKNQESVTAIDLEMKKSITTLATEPDKFKAEEFVAQQSKAMTTLSSNQNEVNLQLAKSIAAGIEAISGMLPMIKSLYDKIDETYEYAYDASDVSRRIARGTARAQAGFKKSTSFAPESGEVVSDEDMLKSVNVKPIQSFLVDKQIAFQSTNPALAMEYSTAYNLLDERKNAGFASMNKSILAECIQFIKPLLPAQQQ